MDMQSIHDQREETANTRTVDNFRTLTMRIAKALSEQEEGNVCTFSESLKYRNMTAISHVLSGLHLQGFIRSKQFVGSKKTIR